jgi:hypothetical protein
VAAVLISLALLFFFGEAARADQVEPVRVSVDPTPKGRVVPPRFIGLSFEASALPALARSSRRGNLVTLLRSLGPGMLRFGGASVDANTAFSADGEPPAWATTTITPRDLARLGTLARRADWRVLLALPLGHYDPKSAAREAAAAARSLGPSLAAVEIGNEPNAFWFTGLRPGSWGYPQYRREIRAYRRAIASAAPGVPIAGPDTALYDGFLWLSRFAGDERPALLTPHYYPVDGCFGQPTTVAELLSSSLAREQAQTMSKFAAIAREHDLRIRVGETNNVPCGGQSGLSDTFAAALWALRYMLTIARAGIDGVNFHTLPETCSGYSAICAQSRMDYDHGRLHAMPEWYALLLFRRLIGQHFARIALPHRVQGLTVDAFQDASAGKIDLVAVNSTRDTKMRLAIRVDDRRRLLSGTVMRLTAPAIDASTRVRLAGAGVGRRGMWRPERRLRRVPSLTGALRIAVPAGTAALIQLRR